MTTDKPAGEMPEWKVLLSIEMPTEEDVKAAEKFVVPEDWPQERVYTDEIRRDIQKVARQIMMRRKTIQ